jgi:hypothetical protein
MRGSDGGITDGGPFCLCASFLLLCVSPSAPPGRTLFVIVPSSGETGLNAVVILFKFLFSVRLFAKGKAILRKILFGHLAELLIRF